MNTFMPPSRNNPLLLAAVGGLTLLGILTYFFAFSENPTLMLGFILFLGMGVVMFLRPEYGLPALLIIRPIVDSIGEYRIAVGNASINVAGAMSMIAIIWALWILARRRSKIWDRELFRSMLLFLVIGGASFLYSWDRAATVAELVRFSGFFLLFLVTRELVTDWAAFRRIVIAFIISLIVPTIVGYGQVLTGTGLTFADSTNRAFGTFGHPNVLAFYLVLGISFLILTWPLLSLRLRSRWPVIVVLSGLLLLTFTRGAWLGLLISLGMIGLVRYRRQLLGGLVGLVVLIAILPTINIVTSSVFDLDLRAIPGAREIIARQAEKSSYQWRLDVWEEMGRRVAERPLLGYGLGAFPQVRELQVFDFFQGVGAHNDYLRLLVETGYLGLLAYVAILFSIFVHLGRLYRRFGQHQLALPALGLIGFSLAFIFMSIFDNLLQATAVMWAFMILLGATLNLTQKPPRVRRKI